MDIVCVDIAIEVAYWMIVAVAMGYVINRVGL